MVSPLKWVGNAGIAINIMAVTQHIVAQYGARISVNTDTFNGLLSEGTKPLPEPVSSELIIGKVQWGDTAAINY